MPQKQGVDPTEAKAVSSVASQMKSPSIRFDEAEFRCGFFGCRPKFLKPLASPLVFLPLFSMLAFCQGRSMLVFTAFRSAHHNIR